MLCRKYEKEVCAKPTLKIPHPISHSPLVVFSSANQNATSHLSPAVIEPYLFYHIFWLTSSETFFTIVPSLHQSISVSHWLPSLLAPILSNHLAYPWREGRDFGVDPRRMFRPTCVTPGCDPVHHPPPSGTLANQRATTVTAATVHAALWLVGAAGAEHAAGEGAVVTLLAMATG